MMPMPERIEPEGYWDTVTAIIWLTAVAERNELPPHYGVTDQADAIVSLVRKLGYRQTPSVPLAI